MRRAGLALLGFAGGAGAGAVVTLTLIWLWFDVLGHTGNGPKPGLDWLFTLGPVLMLGGGIGLAWWLVRRARAGRGVSALVALSGLGVVALLVMLGGLAG